MLLKELNTLKSSLAAANPKVIGPTTLASSGQLVKDKTSSQPSTLEKVLIAFKILSSDVGTL
ncbi:hypothetical protein D3C75_1286290 [compost metagenome]